MAALRRVWGAAVLGGTSLALAACSGTGPPQGYGGAADAAGDVPEAPGTGTPDGGANGVADGRSDRSRDAATGVIGDGTGLLAEYFDDDAFLDRKLVEVDPVIDFRWSGDTPNDQILMPYTFSIRWSGQVQPRFTGKYYFYLETAFGDVASLWLAEGQLIDGSKPPLAKGEITNLYRESTQLVAGQKYDIKVEYRHVAGDAAIHLHWASTSGPEIRAVIPQRQLYPGAAPEVVVTPESCAGNLLLCEGFESGALDPAKWLVGPRAHDRTAIEQVAVDLDDRRVKSGKRSLRVRQMSAVGGREGFIKTVAKLPLGGGTLWVRYQVFIEDPTPNHRFPIFFARDPAKDVQVDPAEYLMAALVPQSEVQIAPSVHEISSDAQSRLTTGLAPIGRWACWEHEIRASSKELLLYVDGQRIGEADLTASYAPGELQLWFGFSENQDDIVKHPDDGYFDIWFDDIAVGNARIGCAP